jgi:hypothetical protein
MQWAWATSLDQLWRSPSFPMWATLIAAGFFALVVLIVLLRADKTMANGALSVIALLAIGIASTTTVRGFGTAPGRVADSPPLDHRASTTQHVAAAPALACLDGLAGESVEAACEKAVFGSPDTAAAAVSYAASQISRVIAASTARAPTPEQQLLRRSVERDRYGLVAQVITVRDRCVATDCPLFRVLTDTNQIKANMNDRLYDTLVARHSPSWNAASAPPAPGAGTFAGIPVTTGRPNSVDFANSAAIPPVSIMNPEPGVAAAAKQQAAPPPAAAAKQQAAPPPPAAAAKSTNAQAQAPTKRSTSAPASVGQSAAQGTPGRPRVVAPVPFAPSTVGDDN